MKLTSNDDWRARRRAERRLQDQRDAIALIESVANELEHSELILDGHDDERRRQERLAVDLRRSVRLILDE
jgi:hypothetical protein